MSELRERLGWWLHDAWWWLREEWPVLVMFTLVAAMVLLCVAMFIGRAQFIDRCEGAGGFISGGGSICVRDGIIINPREWP